MAPDPTTLISGVLQNPLVSGAISRAMEAREAAVRAQEVTLTLLNVPSAADLERLTRRVRSVSQRLEGIEDSLDRLDDHLAGVRGTADSLAAISARLDELAAAVAQLTAADPA